MALRQTYGVTNMATVETLRQSYIFTMLPDLEVLCTTSDISNSFSGRGMFLLEDVYYCISTATYFSK